MVRPTPLLTLLLLLSPLAAQGTVAPALQEEMAAAAPGVRLPAYLVMADQVEAPALAKELAGLHGRARRAAATQRLVEHATRSQVGVRAALAAARAAGHAGDAFVLWMGNALYFDAEPAVIHALAALPGVARIELRRDLLPRDVEDTAPLATSYPFADDFENGALDPAWTVATTGHGTVTVTGADGPLGSYHVEMDASPGGVDSTASLTLSLDLSGQTGVGVRFQHKEFGDEDNDEDGVFVSDDGLTWVKALALVNNGPTYVQHSVEIDSVAFGAGLSYGPDFRIRFQWRDNFAIAQDGFAFDDIEIAPGVGTPVPEPNLVGLQAPQLWDLGLDGDGVLIANLDTGFLITHPDLANRIWDNPGEIPGNNVDDDGNGYKDDVHGWDFVGNDGIVSGSDDHGTLSAGIVCGDGSSGVKITGMAPGATMICLRVLSETQYWAGQQYALAEGADCVTSSASYKYADNPDWHMHRQICELELAADITHANSSGNQGNLLVAYPIPFNVPAPANVPSPFGHPALADGGRGSVIAVGALDLASEAYFQQGGHGPSAWEDMVTYIGGYAWPQNAAWWDYPYGGFGGGQPGLIKPDVVAYTNVLSTTLGSGYTSATGTSAAAPHVAGALCLLLSAQPEAQPRHLAAALELTALDLGAPGKDNLLGSGKIQVWDAARRLVVLGRSDDQTPALGGNFTLDVFGPPNVTVVWIAGLSISAGASDFNLDLPFFVLASFSTGSSGHQPLLQFIPNDPLLSGLTVWSQFTAKGGAPQWGNGRFWSVPEDFSIQ